ncbi:anhydro-N-acetylmuramic acid kinase [Spirochaetia bacterium]|nr:anhydro-N-acetylmuramic acid kinase [Spirochaetia bacterium]
MQKLEGLIAAPKRLCIGLMSGTSLDGMDAALVEIEGAGANTKVKLLEFCTLPYTAEQRAVLLEAVMGEKGGSRAVCCLNSLIGEIALKACHAVCKKAGIDAHTVDFVGSHGQTIYHIPDEALFGGSNVRGTLQVGEASIIAEGLGCVVVSDFRVRDMAAGGQGAPLVPYTEYLLYRKETETVALQNIGGIGNITILPAGCTLDQVFAFDTGPGNMIIDAVVNAGTNGTQTYDDRGAIAAQGTVQEALLVFMRKQDEAYLNRKPPKTTGREVYNDAYTERLLAESKKLGLSFQDTVASVTFYTADTIRTGLERFCQDKPGKLIIGGGGSNNPTLLRYLKEALQDCAVYTNDELGYNSDAKEGIAFAVLANEALHGICNNAPAATGAAHPVVMGKISL